MNDLDYMKLAMDLALKAKGKTSPNPLVGALIVKNNRIVGRGYHLFCGGDHAEVVALKAAGAKAKGAKLYVTLEPCSHFGRTPPCVDKIILSGIKEVIVGMIDPNPLNNGKSIQKLRRAGIKVKLGILEDKLSQMNEWFIKFIRQKMPFVVVKWAQTLDGKIAAKNGHSKWISSEKSRDYARSLRGDFDAILVGINTILKDNPHLKAAEKSKHLKKIILDTRLKIPLGANIFKETSPCDIFIATTKKAPKQRVEALLKKGTNVIICPQRKDRIDLKWLFKDLGRREIASVFVEGGAAVLGSVLKENLADKAIVFVAPTIMGDQDALSAVKGISINNVNHAIPLCCLTLGTIGSEIVVEGYVHRHH